MPTTAQNLRLMATAIDFYGLHRGEQFGQRGYGSRLPHLDISAFAYVVAENIPPLNWPDVFFTDEVASFDLIESSEPAMAVLRAISAALDTDVNETDGRPDYIEHVSTWAITPPVGATEPPSHFEVTGRILRAADQTANAPAA